MASTVGLVKMQTNNECVGCCDTLDELLIAVDFFTGSSGSRARSSKARWEVLEYLSVVRRLGYKSNATIREVA